MASLTLFLEAALREPADALLDPGKRVFLPALLGAGLLSALLLIARGVALPLLLGRLLSPRLWLHRSARLDYQLIAIKALLRAGLLGWLPLSMLAVAAGTAGLLRHGLGTPSHTFSPLGAAAAFTLCGFLADDWSRFFVHRLMHRIPWLWEFHKVHHSAEVLTPFTLYRTHPLEVAINTARGALALGVVTGFFAWLCGPALRLFEVLGVEAIGFVWTLCGANLRHSHVFLSYGPRIERVLVSPAQHQIHHSRDPRHHDRNFGTVLAIWDWLGGSLYTTSRPERLRFGLSGEYAQVARSQTGVLTLLFRPIQVVVQRALGGAQRHRLAAAGLGALVLISCGGGCTSKRLDRAALLQSFGQCTVETYRAASVAADELAAACASLSSQPTTTTTAAARAAWARAIDAWQVAELLRYGPAADFLTLGGKGLREPIYAWPDVNRCLIEEQLVAKAYEGAAFTTTATSTRGLGALEYLLFYEGADNACGPQSAINTTGAWAALSADGLARRKAGYAQRAAADLSARLRELLAAWESGGFLSELTGAGRGSRLFLTQQAAISATAEALFFLDTEVKDRKLALPLGLKPECAAPPCPEALESPWADRGKQHLQSNLTGLKVLLFGCPSGAELGFDDLLEAVGAPGLAETARADVAAAEAAVAAVPGDSLARALVFEPAAVQRVHDAVKEVTGFLKLEFSMALAISSKRVEGDHD
ncbi:MAG: imelysin family protein [Polyangia bacterium]